jgi:SAM-dependent methyltransferase
VVFNHVFKISKLESGLFQNFRYSLYMRRYRRLLANEKNYPNPMDTLEGWVDSHGHTYATTLNPVHEFVISRISATESASVLEVGSGPGIVAKYLYARFQDSGREVDLHCLENSRNRVELMRVNFTQESKIIEPFRDITAQVIHGNAQDIPLVDKSIDLVYTCTVLQHIPFPANAQAVSEIARVSKKYVLHVEGFHSDGVIQTSQNKLSKRLRRRELTRLDLPHMYDELGFDTVEFSTGVFPYQPEYRYMIFLGRRR